MVKYEINLIRTIRLDEKKEEKNRVRILALTFLSFGILLLAIGYAVMNFHMMQQTVKFEREKLSRIEAEYRKYKETKMIVDKADIELLNQLQTRRIYWTRKLEAMASHLPNKEPSSYWITQIKYKSPQFDVKGFGYISPKQEQLITIDDYLNKLRSDSTFNDVFKVCYFNSTTRSDEGVKERVTFDYSALKGVKKK